MNLLLLAALAATAIFVAWGWDAPGRARRRAAKFEQDLETAPQSELVHLTQGAISWLGWERFVVAQRILAREEWTEGALLTELACLEREVLDADQALGLIGPESGGYQFCDAGLATLREVLKRRVGEA